MKFFIKVLFILCALLLSDDVLLAGSADNFSATTTSGFLDVEEDPLEDMAILNKYNVFNGTISISKKEPANSQYSAYQNNTNSHQQIWSLFTKLFPPEKLIYITHFYIATDGGDEESVLAHVSKNDNNNGLILTVDPVDFYDNKGDLIEPELLLETFVHEFGHVITMGPDQFDFSITDDEYCSGFFIGEWGCTKRNTIMVGFLRKFWFADLDMVYEYLRIGEEQEKNNGEFNEIANAKFYSEFRKTFVTPYATTDFMEDFAESFTDYVIEDYNCKLTNKSKTTFCHRRKFMQDHKLINKLKPYIVTNLNKAYVDLKIEKPNLTVEEKIEEYRDFIEPDSTFAEKIYSRAYVSSLIDNALLDKSVSGRDRILYKNFYKEVRNWR